MKILLWIGNESNQRALANKIHSRFGVSAIVTESRNVKSVITFQKVAEKLVEKMFLSKIGRAWFGMKHYYSSKFPDYPNVDILDTENINSDEVYEFTEKVNPDIIIVSGTRLIKDKLLSFSKKARILNLHTGLSPYVKGGPNCTNWCIVNCQFHLIGNTIMWIDKGIDTGNIIATELTRFNGNESLLDVHIKVMEHGHDLYLRAIEKIIEGKSSNVPQTEISKGTTYFNKQWNLTKQIALVKHFKSFNKVVNSEEYKKLQSELQTINL